MITLQSIMNFQIGQLIEYPYRGTTKTAVVRFVDLKRRVIRVSNNSSDEREIFPGHAAILKNAVQRGFTYDERIFIFENLEMPNEDIAINLGRTFGSVVQFKHRHNLMKKYK